MADRTRVLWLDDEPVLVRSMSRILSRDFDIVSTTTTEDAVAQAHHATFDVVVTDLRMGDNNPDGFAAAALIRAVQPDIAVILFTGVEDLLVSARAAAAGLKYVSKSNGVSGLRDAIRRVRMPSP